MKFTPKQFSTLVRLMREIVRDSSESPFPDSKVRVVLRKARELLVEEDADE
jgi:hypothetical protein